MVSLDLWSVLLLLLYLVLTSKRNRKKCVSAGASKSVAGLRVYDVCVCLNVRLCTRLRTRGISLLLTTLNRFKDFQIW